MVIFAYGGFVTLKTPKIRKKNKKRDNQVYQYVYVEEFPLEEKPKEKEEKLERGIEIIDIFN